MLKVGLIGTGYIGNVHAECWSKINNVELFAVCDSNMKKANCFSNIFGAQAFDNDKEFLDSGIDILDVCIPTSLHLPVVERALKRKIAVLCEKPIASNYNDAQRMIKLNKESNTKLMIAHCVRFDPYYAYLKSIIQDNRFGELISLRIYRNSAIPQYSEGQWLLNKNISGGVAMDLHIHDVDVIYWLLQKPEWLLSNANDNIITTIYGYVNKNVVSEASWRMQDPYPFNAGYDAHFENATVVYSDWKLHIYKGSEHIEIKNILSELHFKEIQTDNSYMNEIQYFLDCVMTDTEPVYCLPEDSLNAHRILLSEMESASKQEIIRLK